MNKTYQQLKNKIIKVIPDIKKVSKWNSYVCKCGQDYNDEYEPEEWKYCFRCGKKIKPKKREMEHIRDITLSDCLRVIQQQDSDYPIHIDFYFDKKGMLTITQAKGNPIINKECDWDLTKNALHQQKPEVWELLNNLID